MGIAHTNNLKIKSFTDLNAWKEGHQLVLAVYGLTRRFPKEESQFYSMSLGSLTEAQNQSLIAHDLNYISDPEFKDLAEKTVVINKLLNGLIKKSKTMIHDS